MYYLFNISFYHLNKARLCKTVKTFHKKWPTGLPGMSPQQRQIGADCSVNKVHRQRRTSWYNYVGDALLELNWTIVDAVN